MMSFVVDAVELQRGRDAYAGRAWRSAYESLVAADRASPLAAEDLELLATAASMLCRDDDCPAALEHAHKAYLYRGDTLRAVRCAFWAGLSSRSRPRRLARPRRGRDRGSARRSQQARGAVALAGRTPVPR